MAEVGPILLHSIAPAIMIWGFRELATLDINDSIVIQKGGHWQFLTIQGYCWLLRDFSNMTYLL